MQWDWLITGLLWLYGTALALLSLRLLMRRRPVGVTLSWLLFIYVLPGFGIFFYLLFGERFLGLNRAAQAERQFSFYSNWLQSTVIKTATIDSPKLHPVMQLTSSSIGMPTVSAAHWQLLPNAVDAFEILKRDIDEAKTSIFIETYILQAKGSVLGLLTALEKAAERGVAVYLILDSVGSNRFLRSSLCKKMSAAGVNIVDALHANYLRMMFRRQDLRQHRKLIAIDNHICFAGSMNIADPSFFKTRSGVGPWIDVMARFTGNIAKIIQATLIFDWEMETGKRLKQYLATFQQAPATDKKIMQLLPSGPGLDEELLLQVLLTAIYSAKSEVTVTTPYFVPDESIFQALKAAARRGVNVTVIVPLKNDSKLAQYAGRSFYDELISAGVNIRRFSKGLLHTKTVLVDEHLVLIGSVNLDMRSIWLNFEATVIVDNAEFSTSVRHLIDGYLSASDQVDIRQWRKRSVIKKLLENIAQLASPLL